MLLGLPALQDLPVLPAPQVQALPDLQDPQDLLDLPARQDLQAQVWPDLQDPQARRVLSARLVPLVPVRQDLLVLRALLV